MKNNQAAIDNLEAMLDPSLGVDAVLIGPHDLSCNLGTTQTTYKFRSYVQFGSISALSSSLQACLFILWFVLMICKNKQSPLQECLSSTPTPSSRRQSRQSSERRELPELELVFIISEGEDLESIQSSSFQAFGWGRSHELNRIARLIILIDHVCFWRWWSIFKSFTSAVIIFVVLKSDEWES